jgi:hypothetical protein
MCCPANSLRRTFPTEVGAKDAVVWCAASQPIQNRSDLVSFKYESISKLGQEQLCDSAGKRKKKMASRSY